MASGVFTNALLNLNNGNFTFTGEGSTWNAGEGSFWVGDTNPSNSVVISNGASMVMPLNLGHHLSSSNNSVVVTGAGSSWNAGGSGIVVGDVGSGNSMTISDGASVSVSATGMISGQIGEWSSNNSVLVTGSGSEWIS